MSYSLGNTEKPLGHPRVALLNNADENDGWYETVRLSVSRESNHWMMASSTQLTASQHIFFS
jgi:hypothetical protein